MLLKYWNEKSRSKRESLTSLLLALFEKKFTFGSEIGFIILFLASQLMWRGEVAIGSQRVTDVRSALVISVGILNGWQILLLVSAFVILLKGYHLIPQLFPNRSFAYCGGARSLQISWLVCGIFVWQQFIALDWIIIMCEDKWSLLQSQQGSHCVTRLSGPWLHNTTIVSAILPRTFVTPCTVFSSLPFPIER